MVRGSPPPPKERFAEEAIKHAGFGERIQQELLPAKLVKIQSAFERDESARKADHVLIGETALVLPRDNAACT